MASATRSSRKSPAATAAKPTVKVSRKPAAKKAAPAPAKPDFQDSVTVTMIRGKRDRQTGVIDTSHMPTAGGGVRFEEKNVPANRAPRSPHYMSQADFAATGEPTEGRVTFTVLARAK